MAKAKKELKYTEDHEWIKVEGDMVTVGVTEFAAGELGDIVYVDVDTVGDKLPREEVFGTIEAVKTVSDLFSPVSGEVFEFNEGLEESPDLINTDPYGEGWIVKIQMNDPSELDSLLSAEEYAELTGSEIE